VLQGDLAPADPVRPDVLGPTIAADDGPQA
jgi:hypothetical protein